jgi:hypothetical protein
MNRSHRYPLRAILAALCVSGLGQTLAAQAGPGVIRIGAINKALMLTTPVADVSTDRLPGDGPGIFTCSLTVMVAPGTRNLVIGRYDQGSGTFTRTNEAGALNTMGREDGLSLDPRLGRYAVFTRGTAAGPSSYHFSARLRAGLPFPAPVKISGVPTGTFYIFLGYVGGVLKLFYAQPAKTISSLPYTTIVMQTLNIKTPTAPFLTGQPQVVAQSSVAQQLIQPSSFITGPSGDVEGLIYAEGTPPTFVNTQFFFQAGLVPGRSASVLVPGCGTKCKLYDAAVAGGRINFTADANGLPQVQEADTAWLMGDIVKIGTTGTVFGAVSSPGNIAVTVVLLSTVPIPKVKLPAPFNVGHLGVNLASSLVLGTLVHATATQRGNMKFPVPNNPALRGVSLAIQGLSFGAGKPLAWTNTAWIDLR